jgi:putative ABC transport system permease protein
VQLALMGGALGVLLARVLLDALVRFAPSSLPRTDLISLAGTPLVTAALVTSATVILFGVVPSFMALRFDLSTPLHADARSGTEGRRLRRVRQALVASQIALAVVVLAGAGLLVRSLTHLVAMDMGYPTDHLTMLDVSLPWRTYALDCRPSGSVLTTSDSAIWSKCADATNFSAHERIMASLRALPEVVSLSPAGAPPFLGSNVWMGRFAAEEQSDAEAESNPWFGFDAVGPDFFRALGVPLIEGRAFTNADREGAPRVAVVTERVARRLWPKQSAVGKRIRDPEQHSPDSLVDGRRRRARLPLSRTSDQHADDLQAISPGVGARLLRRPDAGASDASRDVAPRRGKCRRKRDVRRRGVDGRTHRATTRRASF